MSDMTPQPFAVSARRRETEDTWTLELEPGDGAAPAPFAPGQFNMIYAFGHGESAISISGDPADGALVHTVRAVGLTTAAICRSQPGDVLGIRGPFGNAWPVDAARGGDVVVVAGGLGLAPLRPAILAVLAARERYGSVSILYGGRTPDLLLYGDELAEWAARDDVDLALTVDAAGRGWTGRVGVVPALVARAAFDPARTTALVCGPEIMMRFAVAALLDRGVPADRVHLSMERNMQCGIGHCGHCQLGPTLVCRDGPVYPYNMIGPWMAVREL
jgi:anaerobic sulfite reductase subunit B